MPDARISELPAATALGDTDITPLVQTSGVTSETRRATVSQLRSAVLADRGAHVRDYGAKGDGVTNDAPAIQAAINDLKAKGGGTLHFGAKVYRIGSAITVSDATIRFQGMGFTEGPGPGQGTWLSIASTAFTPFTFTGVSSRGSAVRDIAIQQAHTNPLNASWTPNAYDYVFRVVDCLGGVDFDNVFLCDINKGIYCTNSGRLDIRRLRGQVFATGVEIDNCLDVPRIHNLHFWTFLTNDNNVVRWQQANGDAMIFRKVDGVFVDQAFALGYRSMFRFASSAYGNTTKFYIGQAYADFVQYAVLVEADGTEGQIANLTSQGELYNSGGTPLAGSNGVFVNASNTRIQVGNLRVDAVQDNPIRIAGSGNRMDVFALRCVRFNSQNNGAAAIHLVDSGAGTPNSVYLGTPPLLEAGNGGPVVNTGTNGILASGAPAGRAARPGVMVGSTDTGLDLPTSGALAGSAGGVEVLRATSAGAVTLGANPGNHAFEVATPGSTANRLLVIGGTTGNAVSLQAQGVDANVGLALVPKGTGALTAATPDNTTAGGNARGTNAVDWQQARAAATQVASGANAFIGSGANNTASGVSAFIGAGSGNIVSGDRAVIAGGNNNIASGTRSAVCGGNGNQVTGTNSVCGGGNQNTASGTGAWIPGGDSATTRGHLSRGAWAAGTFTTQGDAQAGEFVLRRQTTDATAARLTSDAAAQSTTNTVNLPNSGTYFCRFMVTARQTGGSTGTAGDSAAWDVTALVKRGASASTTSLAGGGASIAPTYNDSAAAAWRLAVAADATNGGIAVSGIGEANKTINWVARILSVEAVG